MSVDSFRHGPGEPRARWLRGWITLGAGALLAAGLLALLLALSRTPGVQSLLPGGQFFKVTLVAHVDLSVLVWFVAGACTLWCLHGGDASERAGPLAFTLAVAGTVLIGITPFTGPVEALMNNYVPVLRHPWFYTGLAAVGAALGVQALAFLLDWLRGDLAGPGGAPVRLALALAALTGIAALACVELSYRGLGGMPRDQYYFDLLFWGGGHVLQFMHTLLMLAAFALLLRACGAAPAGPPRLQGAFYALAAAPLLALPWLYAWPVEAREHLVGFTTLMRLGGSACIPALLLVAVALGRGAPRSADTRPLRAALLWALALFAGGGLMGFMVRGSNTVIPAHYHGSIVGITLAYMGLVYLLLPRVGRPVTLPRLAAWQPFVYGLGQVMHVTALAWTGGHGMQRKTAGAAQGLDSAREIVGMGLMGLGGLVAVAGGVLFLVVVCAALFARAEHHGTRPADAVQTVRAGR